MLQWHRRIKCAEIGSVANRVCGDISMFRNTVKIGVFENAEPDKQLFATEPLLITKWEQL
jgi:hypothetical protein